MQVALTNSEDLIMNKQESYHAIFENAPFAFAVHKVIFDEQNNPIDFLLIDANKAFEEYTGLKLSNILRRRVTEVLQNPDQKTFIEICGKVVTTGLPAQFEGSLGPLQCYYQINAYMLCEDTLVTLLQDMKESRIAQKLLQESEMKYRTLFESTLSPILIVDAEGNYKDANNAALKFLETDLDSLKQKKVGHYDPARFYGKQVKEHYPFLEPKTVETYYKVNGKEKVLLLNIVPVNTQEGVRLFGIGQDITERKHAEDALKQSETRLKVALKNSPVVLFNQDLELRYTWIHNPNPSFDSNSVIGKTDYQLLPPDDAACLTNIKRYVIDTGTTLHEEVRTTIEGQPFFYDLTVEPLFDSTGTIIGVSCASIDITERKRAEEALAAKSAFESIISQNAHHFLSLANLDDSIDECLSDVGNFCKVERAYLFQFNSDGITMSNTHEWCAQGVRSEMENLQNLPIDTFPWWMKLLQAGEVIHIGSVAELPPEAQNEKEILEAQNISSLLVVPFLIKNKLAGFIGFDNICSTRSWREKELTSLTVLADIIGIAIERKRSEEELIRSKEAAEAANVAKSEFLSIVSHELRTPMNAVIGFTDILSQTKLTDEQQRYVGIVMKSGDRLLRLIENLLDFSKIDKGKFELEILDFDLLEIMVSFVDTMSFHANENDLRLQYSIEDNVPLMLLGDKYRLIQILTNLVDNSIKFTSQGEVEIKISVESQEDNVVMLRFVVRDTGIGIPKEKISHIFDRFYQIDSSNTRRFGGVGLGLPISKKLVELMEGEMGVNSEVGEGSAFWFTVKMNIQPNLEKNRSEN